MKILIVSEDIPSPTLGGLGKHALNLAHELATRGHQVDLMGNGKFSIDSCPEQRGPGNFYPEIIGHERGWKQQALGVFSPWTQILNGNAVLTPILRRAKEYDVIHYHGHFPWIAKNIPTDIFFIQTRHDQGGDCMLKTRYRSNSGVCHETDSSKCAECASAQPNLIQRKITSITVRSMRKATALAYQKHPTIFVSNFLMTNFSKVSITPPCGVVIHNAVDKNKLAATFLNDDDGRKDALQHDDSQLELFASGAFFKYKGFEPMLQELVLHASIMNRSFKLSIAGAGPEKDLLCEKFASKNVEFLGWTAYSDVVSNIKKSHAVIVPSVCDEACSTSILEALAVGKTVYALRGGGTPEMMPYAQSAGGRLILSDTMAELAQTVLAHVPHVAVSINRVGDFSNDISSMTDAVEHQYKKRLALC